VEQILWELHVVMWCILHRDLLVENCTFSLMKIASLHIKSIIDLFVFL
jgi:hypothetical protein